MQRERAITEILRDGLTTSQAVAEVSLMVETVAFVGNGPVRAGDAERINSCDVVVRFNRALHFDETGARCDILVLTPYGGGHWMVDGTGPINPRAIATTREVWIKTIPSRKDSRAAEFIDLFPAGMARMVPEHVIADLADTLSRFGAEPGKTPSTGAYGLFHAVNTVFPQAHAHLFGFAHEGWSGHAWKAERKWMNSLVREGRATRHGPHPLWARISNLLGRFRRA